MSKFDEFIYEEELKKVDSKNKEESVDFFIGTPTTLKELNPDITHKEWFWENYLAKRHITLLVAYWKAGKSTMIRALFTAMQNGNEFAGEPTKRCKVLVITEEPEEDWVEKRDEFGLTLNEDIFIWSRPFKGKPSLKNWKEVIDTLIQKCTELKIELLVFDTISTFFPINREKDSDEWLNALIPLYEFTRRDIGILLVHHFRKGAGDEAQAFRGSGVLGSFPSNIIEFTRKDADNPRSTRRVIKTYGRFSQANPEIVIKLLPDNTYQFEGLPWEVSKKAKLEKVVEIFENSKEALCNKDLLKLWDVDQYGNSPSIRTIERYTEELATSNILFVVKTEVVVTKPTTFYGLTGSYREQMKMVYDKDNDNNSPTSATVVTRSLSQTLSLSPENQAQDSVTTVASATRQNNSFDDGWDPKI